MIKLFGIDGRISITLYVLNITLRKLNYIQCSEVQWIRIMGSLKMLCVTSQ